jgi:hypothetical protein
MHETQTEVTASGSNHPVARGPHAGPLPLELTHDAHPHFQPVARRANVSTNENFFAHATACAESITSAPS